MDLPVDNAIPAVETGQQHYHVDDITQRTPCEMQSPNKNLIFTVAYGSALPTQPGNVYHGQQIPAGYARVGVEQVCNGYEMLELDIPEGDGEKTLGHSWLHPMGEALHRHQGYDRTSRLTSPQPASRAPIMSLASPPATPQHSPSPSSPGQSSSPPSPPSRQSSPRSPPSPPAKKQPVKEPPNKKLSKKKEAKEAPKKPWDLTYEEYKKKSNAEVQEDFKWRKP
ncbi:transposon protein, putative, CACTA, En/Spm sub-class [Panicum miliaceum]|uniref:Transposon protein, putative, CACTA, En/Spm sub-class n=1 Tax=Panicum miliaceum TaxID=4540 RepID=A0A3L6PGV1_PANMI|nr:transposon protein, putative, CACTA, En/Spm sub-class [Panicum miliaceum]